MLKLIPIIGNLQKVKLGDFAIDIKTSELYLVTASVLDDFYYKEANRLRKIEFVLIDTQADIYLYDWVLDLNNLMVTGLNNALSPRLVDIYNKNKNVAKVIGTTWDKLTIEIPSFYNTDDLLPFANKEVKYKLVTICPNCNENYLRPFNSNFETICTNCNGVFNKKECTFIKIQK